MKIWMEERRPATASAHTELSFHTNNNTFTPSALTNEAVEELSVCDVVDKPRHGLTAVRERDHLQCLRGSDCQDRSRKWWLLSMRTGGK